MCRAQKRKDESELDSAKGENIKFRSRLVCVLGKIFGFNKCFIGILIEILSWINRGRTSSSIYKFESSKSAAKSVDTSAALDNSGLVDKSMDDPPRTVNGQDTAGKPKSKRMKTGSDIKKNKSKTDDLQKEKAQVA